LKQGLLRNFVNILEKQKVRIFVFMVKLDKLGIQLYHKMVITVVLKRLF